MTATEIADYILWLRREQETTPVQLDKLVYLAQGWALGNRIEPLFDEDEENIIAWPYGPIVTSIYLKYHQLGRRQIRETGVDRANELSDQQRIVVEKVARNYRDYTEGQLSALTHEKGGPWHATRGKNEFIISHRSLRRYYRRKVKLAKRNASQDAR